MAIKDRLIALGLHEICAKTIPGTFAFSNELQICQKQIANRNQSGWKKAEYIIINEPAYNIYNLLNYWCKLTAADPNQPSIQKLFIVKDATSPSSCFIRDESKTFMQYNYRGELVASGKIIEMIKNISTNRK